MSEMLTVGPIASIDGPPPQRRPYDLVATAEIVTDTDERWANSAAIDPYPADLPSLWQPCVEGMGTKPTPIVQPDPDAFLSFGVVLPIFCSAGRGGSYDRLRTRAVAAYEAKESFGVEQAFIQGIGTSPSLAALSGSHILGGGAVAPAVGVGLLEDYIAETSGSLGMIHGTPKGVTLAMEANLNRDTSGASPRLLTKLGTPFSVNAGFIGEKPSGGASPSAKQAWLFATGPVQIRRTEIIVPGDSIGEILDRQVNDVTLYVERNYLVTWDTVVAAAVLIDHSVEP